MTGDTVTVDTHLKPLILYQMLIWRRRRSRKYQCMV